jgi:PII-like signaling protein
VNDACVKLTTYFGERDRAKGGFLADAFTEIYARHELQTSLVMRGVEGFGVKHHLRTDRLLTLSEDLPMVSVAVDTRDRIETALEEVDALQFDGLVTLERARMLTSTIEPINLPAELSEAGKLTLYVGRQARIGRRPAYEAVVALLHERGLAGATVLLGVDGTAHGVRQRARFFGRNADVPLMVIAVADTPRLAGLLAELGAMLSAPLITLERVQVLKRDRRRLSEPGRLPEKDAAGVRVWQKLMVYSGERSRHRGHPLHHELIRRLRTAGAAGATSLRGMWGYHGDHEPHGDTFWQLQRRVPILTVIVDTPERIRELYPIVDDVTDEAGVVTSEMVPALRATGPGIERGALRLARLEEG